MRRGLACKRTGLWLSWHGTQAASPAHPMQAPRSEPTQLVRGVGAPPARSVLPTPSFVDRRRCGQPGQQQGRRLPCRSMSSSCPVSPCRRRVGIAAPGLTQIVGQIMHRATREFLLRHAPNLPVQPSASQDPTFVSSHIRTARARCSTPRAPCGALEVTWRDPGHNASPTS